MFYSCVVFIERQIATLIRWGSLQIAESGQDIKRKG